MLFHHRRTVALQPTIIFFIHLAVSRTDVQWRKCHSSFCYSSTLTPVVWGSKFTCCVSVVCDGETTSFFMKTQITWSDSSEVSSVLEQLFDSADGSSSRPLSSLFAPEAVVFSCWLGLLQSLLGRNLFICIKLTLRFSQQILFCVN